MAKVINIKTLKNQKVSLSLEVSDREVKFLGGSLENMHLFSEDNLNFRTKLVQRGKRDSSKYFLMPKEFREGLFPTDLVECSKIETDQKKFFIFAVNKVPSFGGGNFVRNSQPLVVCDSEKKECFYGRK